MANVGRDDSHFSKRVVAITDRSHMPYVIEGSTREPIDASDHVRVNTEGFRDFYRAAQTVWDELARSIFADVAQATPAEGFMEPDVDGTDVWPGEEQATRWVALSTLIDVIGWLARCQRRVETS